MGRNQNGNANRLFYGDNIDVLRRHIKDESVHLCYIDPPFNSKRTYNQIYNNIGSDDLAQAQAFIDTWRWNDEARLGFEEVTSNATGRYPKQVIELITGLRNLLGEGPLLAYLVSITRRVVEIHRALKSNGSFYFHCDPTASHYLKLVLDAVFCSQGGNFLSEVIWRRTGAHNKAERWAPLHDVIFFYTKSDRYTWNRPRSLYMRGHVEEHFVEDGHGGYRTNYYGNVLTGSGKRFGESGLPWRGFDPTAKDRHWAIPSRVWEEVGEDPSGLSQHQKLDLLFKVGVIKIEPDTAWPIYELKVDATRGPATSDIWGFQPYTSGTVFGTQRGIDEDVRWLSPRDAERLGYPTQKPEGLLERIVRASSDPGDVVLDAYCGCGTTIAVAQRLKRRWVGVDITYQSIALVLTRLEDHFGQLVAEAVVLDGAPRDMASAHALAHKKDDRLRKEFEKWAVLTYTRNRAVINQKRGADAGIDGFAYVFTSKKDTDRVVFQVKSGGVGRGDIAKLKGDMDREKAKVGVLITLEDPTEPMRTEAKRAGLYKHPFTGMTYDRVQIVTIREMLEQHKRLELPLSAETLKTATVVDEADQGALILQPPDEPPQKARKMAKARLPLTFDSKTQPTTKRKTR
jgi:DNA modification methylase